MNDDTHKARRIIRRSRGLHFSTAHISDSTAGVRNVSSEVGSDPENFSTASPALPPPRQPVGQTNDPSDEFNPGDRLREVRARASDYEREYRLDLLHRLLIRKVPLDEIAAQLGISIRQVSRDRLELAKKLREVARNLDIDEMIGDSKGFYDEAAAMSMRAASNASAPLPIRLAAIRTGLAARNDMHRFLQTAGVYDVMRFRKGHDEGVMSDVRRVMENTERLLAELTLDEGDTGSDESVEL